MAPQDLGPMYRPEQAMDGWEKVFGFFGQHLAG
jgi:carboxymethylenebutenolidase